MEIRAHPPERARRSAGVSACCCCCCCCCLHTIGGLVGAAIGSVDAPDEDERRAIKIYWLSFLAVIGATIAAAAALDEPKMAVGLILVALPLGQILTSLLALVVSVVVPNVSLPRLGRITWKSVLLSVGGLAVMIALAVLFS